MGPRLFQDEPGGDRDEGPQGTGGFRIDPADRPFAASEPEREQGGWTFSESNGLRVAITRVFIALLFMAVGAGGLWLAYSKGRSAAEGGGVPLIKADQTAEKVKPDNPGGVSEDGDTPVYNIGATDGAKVEQLLPGPEQPMVKPQPEPVSPPPAPEVAAAPSQPPVTPAPAPVAAPAVSVSPIAPAPATSAKAVPPLPPSDKDTDAASDDDTKDASAAAVPSDLPAPVPPKTKPAEVPKQVAAAGSGSLRIQIAATKDIASAHREWLRLKAGHMDVLGDLKAFGVRVDLGERGIFYRIQAGPITSRADALKRCAALKQSGIGCIIVKQP